MKIGKCVERIVLGACSSIGAVVIKESYRQYLLHNPIDRILTEKKNKERFDNIMRQTNLKKELA